MNDELRVADDLFLTALDDRTGQHVVEARTLGYSLAGAAPDAARLGPVLRLIRAEGDGLFALYERIYDSLWSAAQPNTRSATGDELADPARGGRP